MKTINNPLKNSNEKPQENDIWNIVKNALKYNGRSEAYRLQTQRVIPARTIENVGSAYLVTKDNFPMLEGVTCYSLELWEDCMRIPHWHPNASELGYVLSGTIEIILWRSTGESSMFTLTEGMCWFIPQGALHSLNNIGKTRAALMVGFSEDRPQDIDLPVAFNGVPVPIREAYTEPHSELRQWRGTTENPLVGRYPVLPSLKHLVTGSPYGFDFAKVPPLFSDPELGSVVWGVKSNWNILENISVLRAHLKPGVARDAIWYPDAGTLYIVGRGRGDFHIIIAEQDPYALHVEKNDYIFVPAGVLHTFINTGEDDFEVTAFFNNANPQPEISLAVATGFFPNSIRKAAMTQYGREDKKEDPLRSLQNSLTNPYLLRLP